MLGYPKYKIEAYLSMFQLVDSYNDHVLNLNTNGKLRNCD